MKYKAFAVFILLNFFLSPICYASDNKYMQLLDLSERIYALGVSVLPPQENNWSYKMEHPARLQFGKMGSRKGQSFSGMVVLSKLPSTDSEQEFLKVISVQRQRDSGNPRYENILNKEAITYEKGTTGVRFHTKYKDYGANNLPKKSPFLIIEDFGVIFRHPKNNNVAVTIALSQRSAPDDSINSLKLLSDKFIENARFETLK